jgi:predicted molibdopterin-dependent oxidoreductase YjgC
MADSMFKKLLEPGFSKITIYIDGVAVEAEQGETVAAVILRQKVSHNRTSPVNGSARAPFCMMGVCFDCLATVNGVRSTQSCLMTVQEGMYVERQYGRGSLTS